MGNTTGPELGLLQCPFLVPSMETSTSVAVSQYTSPAMGFLPKSFKMQI